MFASKLEDIKRNYSEAFGYACPEDGWIMNDGYVVKYSQRWLESNRKINFLQGYDAKGEANGFGLSLENACCMCFNNARSRLAVFRSIENKKENGGKNYTLEIWEKKPMFVKFIAIENKHGEIYSSGMQIHLYPIPNGRFFGLDWSHNDRYLAYIAEDFRNRGKSFFGIDPEDSGDGSDIGKKFVYQEDWGENYSGGNPSIFLVDTVECVIKKVPGIPPNLSVGQVQFSPCADMIVFTCWDTVPHRLGMEHCFNRKSAIYGMELDYEAIFGRNTRGSSDHVGNHAGGMIPISVTNPISHSPRFSSDGNRLIYLTSKNIKIHKSTSDLYHVDYCRTKFSSESPIIKDESDSTVGFPGLYIDQLPRRPFLSNYDVVLSSIWGQKTEVLVVHAINGSMIRLNGSIQNFHPDYHHFKILDVSNGYVLLQLSSFDKPPTVAYMFIDAFFKIKSSYLSPIKDRLESLEFHVGSTPADDDTNADIHYIVVNQKSWRADQPLVLYCHGGPHSNITVDFYPNVYFLVKCGFGVVLPNYRGSIGFGRGYSNVLPGKIGAMDVRDCLNVLRSVLSKYDTFSRNKLFVMGGSHGGFLTCHLLAKEEFEWRAGAAINAVTNVSVMEGVSDIPDWAFVETGSDMEEHTKWHESHSKMYQASPIRNVANIKAPLIIIAARDDKRVPFSQSIDFYRKMRMLNKKCKLLLYPNGGHSISDTENSSDCFINIVLWFYKSLNIKVAKN